MAPFRRFCLIGHPVAGSLSPALMQAAYSGRYSYDLVDEPGFEAAWARGVEYDAFNVTAPYKRDAFARADVRDCDGIDACNLIIKADDGFHAFNTDVDGVIGALDCLETGSAALIVGTGGAAAAALAAARELGLDAIVAGRDPEKARWLASAFPGCVSCGLDQLPTPDDIGLIIYTLPSTAPVPKGLPLENAIVLEAEYKNPRLADAPCRKYLSGKLWLLHQAIAGFRLMTGEEPSLPAMREVLGM